MFLLYMESICLHLPLQEKKLGHKHDKKAMDQLYSTNQTLPQK